MFILLILPAQILVVMIKDFMWLILDMKMPSCWYLPNKKHRDPWKFLSLVQATLGNLK